MQNNKISHKLVPYSLSLILLTLLISPVRSFAATAATITSPSYFYNFNTPGTLVETGSESETSSPYWWLNSGAYMIATKDGRGETYQGSLPATNPWRVLYAANNPVDTDNGYHPQNIFRLVTRSKWGDASQEAYFDIKAYNLSNSPQRYDPNGLLLFNRLQDSQNLYYAGVRVDGSAVIKKKINGIYYTMKQVYGVFPGVYNHDTNPNLLPLNKWIGVKTDVVNQADGSVKINLYVDKGWSGNWVLVASAVDNGSSYGGHAFTTPGFGGIRTDFMDVVFENFRFKNL